MIIYWPNLNADIESMIQRYPACQNFRDSDQKESLISTQISLLPWKHVATDLFTRKGSNYLILVNYHSRFFEVEKLKDDCTKGYLETESTRC
ncbi:hypothetical protein QYM36_002479 [Artemia franciscana]|uniref:Uncharacterized protein n=1 Tax=Artemia franciscana TaxID=6661 RepID=A0AA88IJ75_ARTSF|nr:hypothetical protein QYM36_002479 [Artemia franciscana]